MYGGDIDGTTSTVGFEAMTALKRDGTSLIPASLVNVQKGTTVLPAFLGGLLLLIDIVQLDLNNK